MAEPIVSFLIETIGKFMIEEGKFLSGVTEEAEQLHSELMIMRALLKDADERQHEAAIVKEWLSQCRDLAYEAEDVLESHAFKLASRQRARGARNVIRRYACILNECYIRHKVGLEIQSLKARICSLRQSFQGYGIRAVTEREGSSSQQQQLRVTYPYVADDEDFVGFGPDVEKLVQILATEEASSGSYGVVSIYGMGGSGKTTLARKVYNHTNVKNHFDSFAWVCISQQWQTREILREILGSFLPYRRGDIEKWTVGELVEELCRVQQNKKCLLVLDDIWSTDPWECIKAAFPDGRKGNKILLTTRNEDVAKSIGPNGFKHYPKLLTDSESWKLLQKKALRGQPIEGTGDMPNLEMLGKEMVKFCRGLPLAVVVLGGILATKHSFNEWNVVYTNIKSYLRKGESIEQQEGEVQKILALSYNDLPYKLRPCFLYLSGFFEDEVINAEMLYLLWIAEGMIFDEDRIGEESLVDVAERYLGELVKRCIVHVKENKYWYQSKEKFPSCHLHDLMRDLCLAKASEENFSKVLDYRHRNEVDFFAARSTSLSTGNIHRLMISLDDEDAQKYAPHERKVTEHLRTLSIRSARRMKFGWSVVPTAQLAEFQLNRFKMLRSLTIEGVITQGLENIIKNRNSIPDDVFKLPIGNLIHLRYLSLRSSRLVISPSSINSLEHLETLDLYAAEILWTTNVPLRMRRLRYLYLPSSGYSVPIYASSNLEILAGDNPGEVVRDISEVTNLHQLAARQGREGLPEIIKCISHCHKLNHVNLRIDVHYLLGPEEGAALRQLFSSNIEFLSLAGPLCKLPEDDPHFFRNLLELRLHFSRLEEDPVAVLERLPNLQRLTFSHNAFAGKEMVCHSTGFPQLRFLLLHRLSALEKWTVEKGAMANLSRLGIHYCQRLRMIPDGLRFIEPLKELVIDGMPEEFQNRIRWVNGRKGEDLDKICHIPSVMIDVPPDDPPIPFKQNGAYLFAFRSIG